MASKDNQTLSQIPVAVTEQADDLNLAERRRMPRTTDRGPVPSMTEGNSDADWAQWEFAQHRQQIDFILR